MVEGHIANFGISLDVFKFFAFWMIFFVLGILGPPYRGIGATIRIGRDILCLPYAEFFLMIAYCSYSLKVLGFQVKGYLYLPCSMLRLILIIFAHNSCSKWILVIYVVP